MKFDLNFLQPYTYSFLSFFILGLLFDFLSYGVFKAFSLVNIEKY